MRQDTLPLILHALEVSNAKFVLDLGCGGGNLSAALSARGYRLTGLDPNPEMLATASRLAPDALFRMGRAEDIPFDPGTFDAVIFLNSLHHVPLKAMNDALAGALRTLGQNGTLIVVEPLATGPFFNVMQPVEDETIIRAAALTAVSDLERSGDVVPIERVFYERISRFHGPDDFLEYLVAVDPQREELARRIRLEISRLFEENGVIRGDKHELVQPMVFQSFIKSHPSRSQ